MDLFTLQVIISFFVGGIFISLLTLIAERVPLKWRGVILTIPSTLAIGLFFVGLTKDVSAVSSVAVVSVAATLTCSFVFAASFAFFSRRGPFIATAAALMFWAISAILLILFPPSSFVISILFGLPIFLISYYIVKKLPQFTTITPVSFTLKHLILRAVFAGLVVVITVVLAKILGNVWGGVFSAFPAVFSTTLLIYYFTHGKEVIPSVVKSMFFPGAINLVLYALIASVTFSKFGIWTGTLIAYLGVVVFILSYQKIKQR